MKSLLVVGCGYVGSAFAQSVAQQHIPVWGLRRNPDKSDAIRALGVEPICADLLLPETLQLPHTEVVVVAVPPNWRENQGRDYVQGIQNLINVLQSQPPKRLIWISSTSVYSQQDGEWVDESTDPQPAQERSRILLEAESAVLQAPFETMVLRLGGIYGPQRDRVSLLQNGRASVQSTDYINQIHLEDIVGILGLLIEKGQAGEVYLGVDDQPTPKNEFYKWLMVRAGVTVAESAKQDSARASGNKRCSNQKIKKLGYVFKYPTFREGFGTILS